MLTYYLMLTSLAIATPRDSGLSARVELRYPKLDETIYTPKLRPKFGYRKGSFSSYLWAELSSVDARTWTGESESAAIDGAVNIGVDGLYAFGEPSSILRLYSGLTLNYRQRILAQSSTLYTEEELADIDAQDALERKENSHIGVAIPLGAQYRMSDQLTFYAQSEFLNRVQLVLDDTVGSVFTVVSTIQPSIGLSLEF